MIVLKIIGWILLGIIALVILALCVKVKIFAEYSEVDTHVKLKWLFLEIPLYPAKKKESVKKTDTSEENTNSENNTEEETESAESENSDEIIEGETDNPDEQPEDTQAAPKKKNAGKELLQTVYYSHGIDGLLLVVKKVFSYIGTFLGDLLKSVVVEELYIDVKCHKSDAAATAIYYGEVCSALFPMLGALVTKYKVKKYNINVYPDYLARHSDASFAISLHLYPIYVIGITLALVFKLIFKVLIGFIVKCIRYDKNKTKSNNIPDSSTESAA